MFSRWLRLLFLLEMEFPAYIVLWDARFALDNREFSLTNEIFVSLLICLRGDLPDADQSTCMHMLMKPRLTLSPLEVLKTTLYLHDPDVSLFHTLLISFAFDANIYSINQSMESALGMTAGSSRKSAFPPRRPRRSSSHRQHGTPV